LVNIFSVERSSQESRGFSHERLNGLCIYHASEKELPAGYHNNWRLEAHDSQLVREGKMTQRQFLKNMDNGKYR